MDIELLDDALTTSDVFISPEGVPFPSEYNYQLARQEYEDYRANGGDLTFQEWVDQGRPEAGIAPDRVLFTNQLPESLPEELAEARRVGVEPIRFGDEGFDAIANSGTIKWAINEAGELLIIPKYVGDVELKHSVLTNGEPVIAAGEAEIAVDSGTRVGISINRNSGHFQTSAESLELGLDAFNEHGIEFFEIIYDLP
jgi:hypothetical protein